MASLYHRYGCPWSVVLGPLSSFRNWKFATRNSQPKPDSLSSDKFRVQRTKGREIAKKRTTGPPQGAKGATFRKMVVWLFLRPIEF